MGQPGRRAGGKAIRPQNYSKRKTQIAGWDVSIVSYQLGDRFHCTVDNVSPGAWIARSDGATQAEAEEKAMDRAAELLARTRKVKS